MLHIIDIDWYEKRRTSPISQRHVHGQSKTKNRRGRTRALLMTHEGKVWSGASECGPLLLRMRYPSWARLVESGIKWYVNKPVLVHVLRYGSRQKDRAKIHTWTTWTCLEHEPSHNGLGATTLQSSDFCRDSKIQPAQRIVHVVVKYVLQLHSKNKVQQSALNFCGRVCVKDVVKCVFVCVFICDRLNRAFLNR